ncbi:MAG: CPBP family intramembrane metalloprotease [Candidatus Obscuribacterales bacterium]|nr:CPBP family intramembrane metalloprotease [Candidatus Obscuribacterales bacterium]
MLKHKKLWRDIALFVATAVIVAYILPSLKANSKQNKLKGAVSAERAEIPLRVMSTINIGVSRLYSNFGGSLDDVSGKHKTAVEVSRNSNPDTQYKTASKSLEAAIKADPQAFKLRAKEVILLGTWGRAADRKRIAELCAEIETNNEPERKALARCLRDLYLNKQVSKEAYPAYAKLIDSEIGPGWFRDNAKPLLYKTAHEMKLYRALDHELEEKYWRTFQIALGSMALSLVSAFVGLIVIIIQLGSLSRRPKPEIKPPSWLKDVELGTVYQVFLLWFLTQMAYVGLLKLLPAGVLNLSGEPVKVAIFTLVTYVINMGPALFYIYLFVIKPKKLKMADALGLRLAPTSGGVMRQIGAGFLAWCAMLPLVMLSAVIASYYLGSQGSDNAIVAEIISAANSSDTQAKLLLYLTLAVLAPFCEELIFRGFLYASCRQKLGVFFAMLLSALVFAGIHFDKGGLLMLFAIGFVLAFCYERCRSLVPCMVAHGLWNGGSFTMALLLFSN